MAAIRQAIAEADGCASDIGYVNAHGTGTPLNDTSEGAAFATVFGEDGAIPSHLRISSTKAAIGHTLGAAGSIEALFAMAALQSGQLPPNLNVRQPEPTVAANLVTMGERRTGMAATLTRESRVWRVECRAGFQAVRSKSCASNARRWSVDRRWNWPFVEWARCCRRKRRNG